MDTQAFLQQLDDLFATGKEKDAAEHLKKGLAAARAEKDDKAILTVLNELIGFHRAGGRHGESVAAANEAIALCEKMGLSGSATEATVLLNAATAMRAAGKVKEAIPMYEKVLSVYETALNPKDYRLASLYNNISLAAQEMGEYDRAVSLLEKALAIVNEIPGAAEEQASTYTNLAMNRFYQKRYPEAKEYLEKGLTIFRENSPESTHYGAALSLLARLYAKEGDHEKAAETYFQVADIVSAYFGQEAEVAKKMKAEGEAELKLSKGEPADE